MVGILTERDLVKATADGAHPTDATVDQWMTHDPVTMPPDGDITHALDQMMERHFRHIPIVDGDKLVGVVSFRQLVEAAKIRKVDPWAPGTGKGLENITVAETEVSFIDGQQGRLIYRGYNAVELAAKKTFTDVWHLLHFGEFPKDDSFAQEDRRDARVAARRARRSVTSPKVTARSWGRCRPRSPRPAPALGPAGVARARPGRGPRGGAASRRRHADARRALCGASRRDKSRSIPTRRSTKRRTTCG